MLNYYNPKNLSSEVPQEGWDEDVYEGKKGWKYKMLGFGKAVVALMVVMGLLYFSGVYQGSLFSTTPPEAQPRKMPALVEGKTKILPLSVIEVVDVREEREENFTRAKILVERASQIWDQARIDLELKNYSLLQVEQAEIINFLDNPYNLMEKVEEEKREGVVVFLVHSLRGINGVAFVGGQTVAVAEYTTVYNFQVLAHEVGHILGLPHVKGGDRLMSSGASGSRLSQEEAIQAREELRSLLD